MPSYPYFARRRMVVSTGSARIQLCMATFMALSPSGWSSTAVAAESHKDSQATSPASDELTPCPRVHLDVQPLELGERGGEVLGVPLVGPLALLGGRAERVPDHA